MGAPRIWSSHPASQPTKHHLLSTPCPVFFPGGISFCKCVCVSHSNMLLFLWMQRCHTDYHWMNLAYECFIGSCGEVFFFLTEDIDISKLG